jgi:hypothetical protein
VNPEERVMPDRHSIYPVDHFSKDVSEEDLKGLVARHAVSFEIGPHQTLGSEREVLRRGWVVDLYGHPSPADAGMPRAEKNHHIHDVLHAVAITLVPEDRRGLVDAQLERFTGAVRLDPRNDFAEEIRLRIQLEPDTTARMSMVADADTLWRDEIVEKLESLGARPR